MTDKDSEKAVEAFSNLSGEDIKKLEELNVKIQSHNSKWGVRKGGEKNTDGTIEMPWIENDPLIYEFLDFMDANGLLIIFNWSEWDEGSKLFTSEEATKYDNVDISTALKLISTASRKERFAGGTLAWAFELGGFPKLIDRLLELKATV